MILCFQADDQMNFCFEKRRTILKEKRHLKDEKNEAENYRKLVGKQVFNSKCIQFLFPLIYCRNKRNSIIIYGKCFMQKQILRIIDLN